MAHDIAVFAKESASSPVQTLGPEDFPAKVNKPDLPFFVDFFAPVRRLADLFSFYLFIFSLFQRCMLYRKL